MHDLPIGSQGANIDHLVIGPSGVFTINTKNLTGYIWVAGSTFMQNGERRNYIPAIIREARRVERNLSKAVGWKVPALLTFMWARSRERLFVRGAVGG